jgi:uncharacterized protein YkwD
LVSCKSFNLDHSSNGPLTKGEVESKEDTSGVGKGQTGQRSEPTAELWQMDVIDTTSTDNYLNIDERQLILEINRLRTDPNEYARKFLIPIRSYYRNYILQYPGEIGIVTTEGVSALEECIKVLMLSPKMSPLIPKKGLTLAARDQVKDQATTGAVGHTGSDGSSSIDRISRYGKWDITAGENIDYGNADARKIVIDLVVDDSVASRGHRANLLNGKYKYIGVAVGTHKKYRHMSVMDFAGSYN